MIILVLAGTIAAWLYWRSHACLPQLDGTLRVPGLLNAVEILRDARGVPHLRAQSLEDLLFAQGYVTAQDRLWQMDISRRYAQGELSEIFGEGALRLDIENRTLGLRQAIERALGEVDPESRRVLAAYARGVNAFIDTQRGHLPIEFWILHYKPRPWREIDSFSVAMNMMKLLNTTWPDELMREHIRSKLSSELYADLFPDHSPLDEPVAELAPRLGTLRKPPQPGRLPGIPVVGPVLMTGAFEDTSAFSGLGSNNWVVNGTHTRSGKPLLANDPHLGHSVPSVWYMIHLKGPALNVSGVSLPGLPLVIIGHNERIAWGMTNTAPDVQDLYAETFNLGNPKKYLHNGEWIDDEEREEIIKVRGARDYRFTVKVTRHGPVVSREGDHDLALCWTALEAHALRFPSLKIDRAQNWQEFTDGLRDFSAPMQNFVYADADGNIGYYAAGLVPIRKQGDGTVPSPGDIDDHDWAGFIPFEDLPHAYNPPGGMIATANGRIVPDAYPQLITHKWEAPYRTARIFQLLRAGRAFTVDDMLRIQTDVHSLEDAWLKKELLAAAAQHPPQSPDARDALSLIRDWDGEARQDSAATLVLEVSRRALLERVLKPKLGDEFPSYRWPMSTTFLENVLRNRWPRWLPPGDADFNVTLVKSLEEGIERISQLVGSRDRSAWKWGQTIPLIFRHRLSGSLPFLGRLLNTGPYPQSGTATTVKQTTSTVGPSMRMVVDFSNFDGSVQNITLGESGQVLSPHYRDQFQAWYSGRSFPMLFRDAAVDAGAIHRLVLEPAAPP
jgi:penicillin amidase